MKRFQLVSAVTQSWSETPELEVQADQVVAVFAIYLLGNQHDKEAVRVWTSGNTQ